MTAYHSTCFILTEAAAYRSDEQGIFMTQQISLFYFWLFSFSDWTAALRRRRASVSLEATARKPAHSTRLCTANTAILASCPGKGA